LARWQHPKDLYPKTGGAPVTLMPEKPKTSNSMSQIEVLTFQSIAKEIKIDSQGRATVTVRGAARIVGVTQSTLSRQFEGDDQNRSKLAEKLLATGLEADALEQFLKTGIPDTALSIIVQYYAIDAGRYCTELAKTVLSAFLAFGLRSYLQRQVGWQLEPLVEKALAPKAKALPLPELTMRSRIVIAVDNYVFLFGISHQQVWTAIYRKLLHAFGYNVKARLKSAGVKSRSKLKQIEIDGKLEELRSAAQAVVGAEI
jgi:hypothetical protein